MHMLIELEANKMDCRFQVDFTPKINNIHQWSIEHALVFLYIGPGTSTVKLFTKVKLIIEPLTVQKQT